MAMEQEKALEQALAQLEKRFGKGTIMKLGDPKAKREGISVIPTGCLTLDLALGIGGVPRGRVVEIFGPESSGKTTVALHIISEAQKMGGVAAFIDAEHALDPIYAKALGVDVDELYVSQPDTGEQALEILEALVRSGAVSVIVVDSVAALVPKAEIEGLMGDSHIGLQARLMSQALRKLTGALARSETCAIFINQLRDKVSTGYGNGPTETTTGGKALKFYSSIRIDVRRKEQIKTGQEVIGNKTRVKIVKNKLAPPFKQAEFDILYGKGVSKESVLLDAAVDHDIITKTGSWYSYGELRMAQGRDKARIFLEDNPEMRQEVEDKVRAILFAKEGEETDVQDAVQDDTTGEMTEKKSTSKKKMKDKLKDKGTEQGTQEDFGQDNFAEMDTYDEQQNELVEDYDDGQYN